MLTARGKTIGEPGERIEGMAQHVGAGAPPGPDAADDRAANYREQVGRGRSRHRLAKHATGGKEIIRYQGRQAQALPLLISIIDDLDRRQISLDGIADGIGRERRLRGREVTPEPDSNFAFDADADEIT